MQQDGWKAVDELPDEPGMLSGLEGHRVISLTNKAPCLIPLTDTACCL